MANTFNLNHVKLTLLVILIIHHQCEAELNEANQSPDEIILNKLLSSYNKNQRPILSLSSSFQKNPLVIQTQVVIQAIDVVDDLKMEIGTELILRLRWMDPRLIYEYLNITNYVPEFIAIADMNLIWFPDTYISSSRPGKIHELLKPSTFTRLYPNGTLFFSARLSLVVHCPMDFRWFPFDTQSCSSDLASYGFSREDMIYQWNEFHPFVIPDETQFSKFKLKSWSIENGDPVKTLFVSSKFQLTFERQLSYFISNTFLPLFICICMSWSPFWLDLNSIEARVTIGVSIMLTVSTTIFGLNQLLPPVSYTRAIDIFTGFSFGFVAAAFVVVVLIDCARRGNVSRIFVWCPPPNLLPSNKVGANKKLNIVQQVKSQITNDGNKVKKDIGDDNEIIMIDEAEINYTNATRINNLAKKGFPIVCISFFMFFLLIGINNKNVF